MEYRDTAQYLVLGSVNRCRKSKEMLSSPDQFLCNTLVLLPCVH